MQSQCVQSSFAHVLLPLNYAYYYRCARVCAAAAAAADVPGKYIILYYNVTTSRTMRFVHFARIHRRHSSYCLRHRTRRVRYHSFTISRRFGFIAAHSLWVQTRRPPDLYVGSLPPHAYIIFIGGRTVGCTYIVTVPAAAAGRPSRVYQLCSFFERP